MSTLQMTIACLFSLLPLLCHVRGILVHYQNEQNSSRFIKAYDRKKAWQHLVENRQTIFTLSFLPVKGLANDRIQIIRVIPYSAFGSRQCRCIANLNTCHTAIDTRSHPGWNNTHSHVCLFRDIFLCSFHAPSRCSHRCWAAPHIAFAINFHSALMVWA